MVGLVSSRHTYSTFVFRYRENGGKRIEHDIIINLVHVPPPTQDAAKFERDPRMERLDPNEWKKQDHYVVLGLEDKRGDLCTPEDVRNAYRARVLVYHPDKIAQRLGKGKGKSQKDDAIFKCIQKAFEVLSDADRKESFDSVDPTFDESIPSEKLPTGADFYATYGPVFARNLRFAKPASFNNKKGGNSAPVVTDLGDASTPRESVEAFYKFWFDFESTRRFDYLDEDDAEALDNRADKRYQEKKNKAARQKRKNEDNARLIKLVENAYKADPRIKEHKEADKAAKAARKASPVGKAVAANGKAPAGPSKLNEEAAAKAAAEEAARAASLAAAADAKKAKEAEASALRKERKALKTLFGDANYFVPTNLDASTRLKMIEEEAMLVEQICQKLERLEIAEVNKAVLACGGDPARITNVLRERLGVALVTVNESSSETKTTPSPSEPVASNDQASASSHVAWTMHDMDLLINGTKKFPGGTRNRWEVIAEWFNRTAETQRTVDDLLRKSNELKASTTCQGGLAGVADVISEPAVPVASKRDPRIDQNEPTLAATNLVWTADEQAALEAAIKSVPSEDAERWDHIAALVPSRTKKECMMRAKELATALKKKATTA